MIQHDINPLKQHLRGFKIARTRFYTAIDCKTTKNGDEIFHFRKKKIVGFVLLLITFLPSRYELTRFTIEKPMKFYTRKSVSSIYLNFF